MSDRDLVSAIKSATRKAAELLFSETGEKFYYFSLITTGEGLSPYISAWSLEALERVPEFERDVVKWSYADSPYCNFGAEYFGVVQDLFSERPDIFRLSEEAAEKEFSFRLNAMEAALRNLSEEGLFGVGQDREEILVNAEVMPPDHTNTARGKRLNHGRALEEWLIEAAE